MAVVCGRGGGEQAGEFPDSAAPLMAGCCPPSHRCGGTFAAPFNRPFHACDAHSAALPPALREVSLSPRRRVRRRRMKDPQIAGRVLPPLSLRRLKGHPARLLYNGLEMTCLSTTLFFFFSTHSVIPSEKAKAVLGHNIPRLLMSYLCVAFSLAFFPPLG